jgi:thioredoxin 1
MHEEMDKLSRAFPRGVAYAKFNCGQHEEFSTRQRIRSLPTFRCASEDNLKLAP